MVSIAFLRCFLLAVFILCVILVSMTSLGRFVLAVYLGVNCLVRVPWTCSVSECQLPCEGALCSLCILASIIFLGYFALAVYPGVNFLVWVLCTCSVS